MFGPAASSTEAPVPPGLTCLDSGDATQVHLLTAQRRHSDHALSSAPSLGRAPTFCGCRCVLLLSSQDLLGPSRVPRPQTCCPPPSNTSICRRSPYLPRTPSSPILPVPNGPAGSNPHRPMAAMGKCNIQPLVSLPFEPRPRPTRWPPRSSSVSARALACFWTSSVFPGNSSVLPLPHRPVRPRAAPYHVLLCKCRVDACWARPRLKPGGGKWLATCSPLSWTLPSSPGDVLRHRLACWSLSPQRSGSAPCGCVPLAGRRRTGLSSHVPPPHATVPLHCLTLPCASVLPSTSRVQLAKTIPRRYIYLQGPFSSTPSPPLSCNLHLPSSRPATKALSPLPSHLHQAQTPPTRRCTFNPCPSASRSCSLPHLLRYFFQGLGRHSRSSFFFSSPTRLL